MTTDKENKAAFDQLRTELTRDIRAADKLDLAGQYKEYLKIQEKLRAGTHEYVLSKPHIVEEALKVPDVQDEASTVGVLTAFGSVIGAGAMIATGGLLAVAAVPTMIAGVYLGMGTEALTALACNKEPINELRWKFGSVSNAYKFYHMQQTVKKVIHNYGRPGMPSKLSRALKHIKPY